MTVKDNVIIYCKLRNIFLETVDAPLLPIMFNDWTGAE